MIALERDIETFIPEATVMGIDKSLALLLTVQNDAFVSNLLSRFTNAANPLAGSLALFGATSLILILRSVGHSYL